MSQDDLERRLQRLQVRGPDPGFASTLKSRMLAELARSAPVPWWSRNRLAVVNGVLAFAVVALVLWQPGIRSAGRLETPAADVADVDTVRESYRPSALLVLSRLQHPIVPIQAIPETTDTQTRHSRRQSNDHQTAGVVAAGQGSDRGPVALVHGRVHLLRRLL